jgi:S1-C subfamily serine protease/regulator of sirC expression with transglutaminase-like and TPR domain
LDRFELVCFEFVSCFGFRISDFIDMFRIAQLLLVVGVCFVFPAAADEAAAPLWVKELAARARPSVVVIGYAGRDGGQQGLGTGFAIDKGLVATNLHVIGEARPISVTTADGKSLSVKAVYASDRALDLAILEVTGVELPALAIMEGEDVAGGEPIVVMGNPQGLKYSVVTGVVSSTREFDGRRMIQLAIPVEPGNSGGPVLDAQGRVLGVVTMKSAITENLGFAVMANYLKVLRDKPNTVPMERWLTIGAIDQAQWEPLFGARWQQRAGRIVVDGVGAGFGGRSLLLARRDQLELPFEVGVQVKLDDEAGAAGLVFHADGKEQHYGFYPSNGRLRLSRFEGPDVFSWHVLVEKASDAYRPGQWNALKVRLGKERLECFVNEQLVIESTDQIFKAGRVGLAKFRNTGAEFRGFAVAKELPSRRAEPEALAKVVAEIEKLPPLAEIGEQAIAPLAAGKPELVQSALLERARELEARGQELKRLAADVRTTAVVAELDKSSGPNVAKVDLLRGALIIARLDEEELDIEEYVEHVERMASEIKRKLPQDASDEKKLAALNDYLFKEQGFHGSRTDYYHRANSYLNRVIDDREGLPITLAVLYIDLGSRLGLKIEGVALPAHFIVRHVPRDGQSQLIDVFEGAKALTRDEAETKVLSITGERPQEEHFRAASERQILQRILGNLIGNAQNPKAGVDREALIRYESAMLTLEPTLVRDRGLRAVCRWETGRRDAAVADLQVLLDSKPAGLDLEELAKMQEFFRINKPPPR